MAIDFPANPTNGQVYGNYIYDSSITAWRNVNTDTGIGTLNAMGLKNIVPTSINVSGGSATVNANGLVSFSAATSLSLNGIFTSTYSSYRIILGSLTGSVVSQIFGRWRASGTDTSASYDNAAYYVANSAAAGVAGVTGTTLNSFGFVYHYNSTSYKTSAVVLDVYGPQLAQSTTATYQAANYDTRFFALTGSTYHNPSTQFDGFTIFPGSGNISGTIQVFGYTQ